MKLYNSLTREKGLLKPIADPLNHVSMYVCGPTVYDRAHIGNARPVVVFDTLYKVLEASGYDVTYVRNITDVDDKIIVAAEKNGEGISTLTERTTQQYHEDMGALNDTSEKIEPRATQHIDQMIDIIKTLIKKDHAYEAEGHVLFDTNSDKSYGCLSGRDLDDMIAGARVEVAPYKKNPADFVLWKPSEGDTPGWESPWGKGRPGWHIECSAMSHKHLGETFDIHGGGLDLIFPHHENEVAQSTCAFGEGTFAKTWMHNGMLMVEGKKMSKSLGNFFTVRDLLEKGIPGEVIRLTLLSAHYRQPLDWTQKGVEQSKAILDKFYTCLKGVKIDESPEDNKRFTRILDFLEDDLNTPRALSLMSELAKDINLETDQAKKRNLASQLKASANLIGLLHQDPEAWFKSGVQTLSDAEIEDLIQQRAEAKQAKNYAEADRVRDLLDSKGILLEDSPTGTTWKQK